MLKIETKVGSATSPTPDGGIILIPHICNTKGGWGSGFVLAVSALSKAPENAYRAWAKEGKLELGSTQFVEAKPGVIIANMIAQDGYAGDHADGVAVDYEALEKCLKTVFERAYRLGADVHLPAGMGSGLAGGDRSAILGIIGSVTETISKQFSTNIVSFPFNLHITLWEFVDTTSASYIPAKKSPTPDDTGAAIESDDLAELG